MRTERELQTKKIALTALLAAFAAVLGYIDAILPVLDFLPLPGVKLGLANYATLFALYLLGAPYAAAVCALRILLINLLLFPSPTALVFSVCGGALSYCVMLVFRHFSFHKISVSVAGAVTHNLAQLLAAAVMLSTPKIFSYFAILFPVGILTGALLGLLTTLIVPRVEKIVKKQE